MRWHLAILSVLLCAAAHAQDADPRALLLDDLPPTGLLGEWRILDGQQLADESGYAADLVLGTNAAVDGRALLMNGTSAGYATVTNSMHFAGYSEMGVSFWAKASDANANWFFSQSNGSVQNGFEIQWRPDVSPGLIILTSYNSNGNKYRVNRYEIGSIAATNWNHIYATWRAETNFSLHVNGVALPTHSALSGGDALLVTTAAQVRFGNCPPPNRFYRGQMGKMAIFNHSRTNEIERLFLEGPPQ